ncbi:uncharacterized protein EI90DRAFT_208434 [Cantharellus anzutake]|uniref:uncharacterized protein n=1 Tax=Cantharellus anzutake TaxID=1750568 RepID=UPI0019072057|nr:uncharacterized protein EI90DRAFT_208434 [Cantharellus anzutake]KAF8317237.1 hypothetical protein EI90DRAFT_208434 [Cantharellus anzutake]
MNILPSTASKALYGLRIKTLSVSPATESQRTPERPKSESDQELTAQQHTALNHPWIRVSGNGTVVDGRQERFGPNCHARTEPRAVSPFLEGHGLNVEIGLKKLERPFLGYKGVVYAVTLRTRSHKLPSIYDRNLNLGTGFQIRLRLPLAPSGWFRIGVRSQRGKATVPTSRVRCRHGKWAA